MSAEKTPLACDVEAIDAIAARCAIDEDTRRALRAAVERFETTTLLARTVASLRDEDPTEAMAAIDDAAIESALGVEGALLFWLAVAVALVPDGEARHRALGVDAMITRDTFRDIALWTDHFRARFGLLGLTKELVDWTLDYQRGRVFRVGMLQWELRRFDAPVIAVKPRANDEWMLVADERATFVHDGRFRDKYAARRSIDRDPSRVEGHLVDASTGTVTAEQVSLARSSLHAVIDERSTLLDMHIPSDARLALTAFQEATRDAYAFFARHFDGVVPEGLFGEAWLLDPQIAELLPSHAGLAAIQSVCLLYPGAIPEAKTIRRIFGPRATRERVVAAKDTRPLNTLQRAVVSVLEDPAKHLCARGGLMPLDRIRALAQATGFSL